MSRYYIVGCMSLPFLLRLKFVAFQRKLQRWFDPNFNQEHFERQKAEYLILSRPSCGRTWLRVMIGHILKEISTADIGHVNPQTLFYLHQLDPSLPSIKATHEQFLGADSYRNKRVILLVRDPRGAVLSHTTKVIRCSSELEAKGFSEVMRSDGYLDQMIHFYNDWSEYKTIPMSFMMLRYEDLVENTHQELQRLCDFLKIQAPEHAIDLAISNSSFDKMHKFDNRSFKFRSGKAYDFKNELSRDDLEWIEQQIHQTLVPFYGYRYSTFSEVPRV